MIYEEPLLPDWARLHPSAFEALVASVLRREHPEGYRPDGAGGDGGQDFVVLGPGGRLVYQIKHFHGRLDRSRRRQVERSIAAVGSKQLRGWVLVVPIDPTESEKAWFGAATAVLGVPCEWYGLNWLNTQLPKHPDLLVSHLGSAGSARARVQDGLGAIGNDIVRLDDVIAAQQRLNSAADLLNPNFQIRTVQTVRGPAVHVTPKPGTTMRFDLAGIESLTGKVVAEAIRFGAPARFEAPAQLLGLPDELFGERWVEWTIAGQSGPPVEVRLEAAGERGRPQGEIRFAATRPTIGHEGAQIVCTDPTGWLSIRLRLVNSADRQANLNITIEPESSAFPDDLLRLFDFLSSLSTASHLGLILRVNTVDYRFARALKPAQMTELVAPAFDAFVRDMNELQLLTGVRHPLLIDHPDIDARTVNEVVRKLNGEVIEVDGVVTASLARIDGALVDGDHGHALVIENDVESLVVQDRTYPLDATERVTCAHAVIENIDEVRKAHDAGGGCDARFRPAPGHRWHVMLGTRRDTASQIGE